MRCIYALLILLSVGGVCAKDPLAKYFSVIQFNYKDAPAAFNMSLEALQAPWNGTNSSNVTELTFGVLGFVETAAPFFELSLEQFIEMEVRRQLSLHGLAEHIVGVEVGDLPHFQDVVHRKLLSLLPNTTSVVVAVQSQTKEYMDLFTNNLNARLLTQMINSRQLLQVTPISSTVSYIVPGDGEAINMIRRTSPSLVLIKGISYNTTTQVWTIKFKHMADPDSLVFIYLTKAGEYKPGDYDNPCIQSNATTTCFYDIPRHYWSPAISLPVVPDLSLTAKALIESLPRREYMNFSQDDFATYYASPEEQEVQIVTVEFTQLAAETKLGTLDKQDFSVSRYNLGVGVMFVRPNESMKPDVVIDFSGFQILSINHYTFSVATTQDYTVLTHLSASMHKVHAENDVEVHYLELAFSVPQDFTIISVQDNLLAYQGATQTALSDLSTWRDPCDAYAQEDLHLSEECTQSVSLDFCNPVVHDFVYRPGKFVNLRVPFVPNGQPNLFVSVLIKFVRDNGEVIYNNLATQVQIGSYIEHCLAPTRARVDLDTRFVNTRIYTGLSANSPFNATFDIIQFIARDDPGNTTSLAYHIDLTGGDHVRSVTESLINVEAIGDPAFFEQNELKSVSVDALVTVHTTSEDKKAAIDHLVDTNRAYYTQPQANGPTELFLYEDLTSICNETTPDCKTREEIVGGNIHEPFYVHKIDGFSDAEWLKGVIGTSTFAQDLATDFSEYRFDQLPDPRYNLGYWVYPAMVWPNRSLTDLSEHVFVFMAFSVNTMQGQRRLLGLRNRLLREPPANQTRAEKKRRLFKETSKIHLQRVVRKPPKVI